MDLYIDGVTARADGTKKNSVDEKGNYCFIAIKTSY